MIKYMNKLYFYNTLTRQKEEFKPIDNNRVGVYTCGPTVYNYAHIGNLRSYVFADLLVKILRYNFGKSNVRWVMNITDVEDKTIRDSKIKYPDLAPMEALKKFTAEFEGIFWLDTAKLNIAKPDFIAHAADAAYVKKMQALIKNIFKAGYAYIKDGSVYFDVVKYSKKYKYGLLVDIDVSKLKSGERVDDDEYEKDNVQDFVLWKGQKAGEPFWDFELDGQKLPGRPGWHIECSAMGEAALGMPFDIHTGGVDLKFPHHENEIHQSVIGYGVKKPVNYWLHNEHLLVDGQRMGKRFNNFYTLKDLEEKNLDPLAYRFLCLQTGYGKVMNFTWQALESAAEGLRHLQNQVRGLNSSSKLGFFARIFGKSQVNSKFKNPFLEAINDDLNMPRALAAAQELLKSDLADEEKLATIIDFDKVLGLGLKNLGKIEKTIIPDEIEKLAKARLEARQNKNWQEADRLRLEIEKFGYLAEDTKNGQRISKK
ncbi:MAG: cysteine--tRNA ligase [bacterium]|nr:cysteine--tRNA ligase [bacterium]